MSWEQGAGDDVLGAIQYAPARDELLAGGLSSCLPGAKPKGAQRRTYTSLPARTKDLPRPAEQVLSSPQMAVRYGREGPLEGEVRAIRKS